MKHQKETGQQVDGFNLLAYYEFIIIATWTIEQKAQ